MKVRKLYLLVLLMAILSFAGCAAKEVGETVTLKEIGLSYQIPTVWKQYEKTNLYPTTISSEGTLAQIRYYYVPEEMLNAEGEKNPIEAFEEALKPICEIVVLPKENVETAGVQNLFSGYSTASLKGEQGIYAYYLLSGYTGDLSAMTGEQKKVYDALAAAVPALGESISTTPFDAAAFEKKIESNMPNALTFQTETLYGAARSSLLFGKYKLTMVNFGATYAYDESAVLQAVYEQLKQKEDVHLLTAYIDTPETATNKAGMELRETAGASYDTIVMDEVLAAWATENLNGVPTTVFVNSDGYIVGEKIEGAKTAEEYLQAIENALKAEQ